MEDIQKSKRVGVYDIVTDTIIRKLEQGVIPWKQTWQSAGIPRNYLSGKAYRGINLMLLNSLGYETNIFLTYKQAEKSGGKVKKGEKAHLVVFWKWFEKEFEAEDEETEVRKIPMLRYYHVFNIAQCVGLPYQQYHVQQPQQVAPIRICKQIIHNMPNAPVIYEHKDIACYDMLLDTIHIPPKKVFFSMEEFYATLFHELVHSTGHPTRLNRKGICQRAIFGSETYSYEELIAEIGACYLAAHADIVVDDFSNNIAYINGWLNILKSDHRLIIRASAQAQKATDFILNRKEGCDED
jgi:antirestriction protein ArdC